MHHLQLPDGNFTCNTVAGGTAAVGFGCGVRLCRRRSNYCRSLRSNVRSVRPILQQSSKSVGVGSLVTKHVNDPHVAVPSAKAPVPINVCVNLSLMLASLHVECL